MLNNLSIRNKLALLLVGPLLALLAITALGIRGNLTDLSTANDADRRVSMANLNGRLFDALRAEAVQNLNAVATPNLALDEVRATTDSTRAAWVTAARSYASLDVTDLIDQIENLNLHRDVVTAQYGTGGAGAELVYEADIELLRSLVAFDARVAGRSEPAIAAELLKANDLNSAGLAAADAQLLGLWAAHTGLVQTDDLATAVGRADSSLVAYAGRAEAAEQVRDIDPELGSLSEGFGASVVGDATTLDPAAWEAASTDRADAISEARRTVLSAGAAAATTASSDAQSGTRTAGALALIGLLLGLAALFLVGSGLRKRLRSLSTEAAALAKHDLPELSATLSGAEPTTTESRPMLEVEGGDEITEVGESLNDVRRATESVADQQHTLLQSGISDMFVNLARRNQALVDRQLEVIDQLESNERDSDRLAQMYRVDHLATRMRRNAESLLVLAGHHSPRRRGPAVDLREVVRVAIGEVEDYRRIVPVALDDLFVAGHVAQDLAHLLSELMENATQSSAPGTVADVIGIADPSGSYSIQVIDRGTGLSDERRNELNHLLANPPSNNLSMSRSLGLTVVGRLAKRLAISVSLHAGSEAGTTATVAIPADIVTEWRAGEAASGLATVPLAPAPLADESFSAEPMEIVEESTPIFEPLTFGDDPAPETTITEPTPEPAVEPAAFDPALISEPAARVEPAAPIAPLGGTPAPATPSEIFGTVDVPPMPEPEVAAAAAPDLSAFEAPAPEAPAVPSFDAPVFDAPAVPSFETPAVPSLDPQPVFDAAPPAPPATHIAPVDPLPEPPSLDSTMAPPPVAEQMPAPPTEPQPVAEAIQPPPMFEPPAPPGPPAPAAEAPIAPSAASIPPIPEPGAVFEMTDPPSPAPAPVAEAPIAPPAAPAPAAPTPEPATTPTGLVKRRRSTGGEAPRIDDTRTAPSKRSPDQVKNMLSRYKTGLERGRNDGGQEISQ